MNYFNGIKKLNQRNENSGNKDTEQFYVHTLIKEYEILAQMLCSLLKMRTSLTL